MGFGLSSCLYSICQSLSPKSPLCLPPTYVEAVGVVLAQPGRHGGDPRGGARRQRYRDPQVVAPLIAVQGGEATTGSVEDRLQLRIDKGDVVVVSKEAVVVLVDAQHAHPRVRAELHEPLQQQCRRPGGVALRRLQRVGRVGRPRDEQQQAIVAGPRHC